MQFHKKYKLCSRVKNGEAGHGIKTSKERLLNINVTLLLAAVVRAAPIAHFHNLLFRIRGESARCRRNMITYVARTYRIDRVNYVSSRLPLNYSLN